MLKKKLTLMVIPDSTGFSKELSLSVALLYIGAASVVVLLFLCFFLAAEFFGNRVTSEELDRLRAENEQLIEKYEQMRWDLSEMDARYYELVQKEIAIRTIFDLPEINSEERQLGIGGPGPPAFISMTEAQEATYATEVEVDRLLRLSRFELEKFGEVEEALTGLKDRLTHTPSIWPAKGWNSRGFGMKNDPFTGLLQLHRGIDIANHIGTPVIATADGVVKSMGKFRRMGRMMVIDHGYGFVTRYGHLSKYAVKQGQKVKRGNVIGYMGNSGRSTGPHLHYEVWRNGKILNPRDHILNTM